MDRSNDYVMKTIARYPDFAGIITAVYNEALRTGKTVLLVLWVTCLIYFNQSRATQRQTKQFAKCVGMTLKPKSDSVQAGIPMLTLQ